MAQSNARSSGNVPEVSLITSWAVPSNREIAVLPGMCWALEENLNLLDLYFLNHFEIPWYRQALGEERAAQLGNIAEPHRFAASLSNKDLDRIADTLRSALVEWYGGKLVGRRPRFAAIATFFPDASSLDRNRRIQAMKALRNTLYLAGRLGVSCVEIVGGSGVPDPDDTNVRGPNEYREDCWKALVDTLCEVFDMAVRSNPLKSLPRHKLPKVAVELEPGPAFLLNELEMFDQLRRRIDAATLKRHQTSVANTHTYLNIDIAHAFIIGYSARDASDERYKPWVAHIHASDHGGDSIKGGTHASDLPPDIFHYFDDYKPWLRYAIELHRQRDCAYSGVIAIEMEACRSITEAISAVQITRQWLGEVGRDDDETAALPESSPPPSYQGALLVIDIGNSTKAFFNSTPGTANSDPSGGAERLESAVQQLCKLVHSHGGSVMSFTGDGFIAIFEELHFIDERAACAAALLAAGDVCRKIKELRDSNTPPADSTSVEQPGNEGRDASPRIDVTVRASLHWGTAYIPSSGRLRDQIIGEDVVRTSRLCDWLGKIIEPAQPKRAHDTAREWLLAATKQFKHTLSSDSLRLTHKDLDLSPDDFRAFAFRGCHWTDWGGVPCKGLDDPLQVYLLAKEDES